MSFMPFLGPMVDLGTSLANFGLQASASNKNYRLAKEQFAWQQAEANLTREREDTAIQRRAADMQAAGLNPLLAAGSPAASSTPISNPVQVRKEAPQLKNLSIMDQVQIAQALRLGKANVSRTEAENLLLRERARAEGANADIAELERDIAKSAWNEDNESTLTVRGHTRVQEMYKLRAGFQDLMQQVATNYARMKGINADTVLTELNTAIRERDFKMLKEFGVMDSRGQYGKYFSDLASSYGLEYALNNMKVERALDYMNRAISPFRALFGK